MAARAKKYVAEGYRRLQVKVGLDVREDIARLEAVRDAIPAETVIFCDANGSWGTAETRQFLMATRSVDYTLEQPCATYEENLAIRRACDRPLVLDETIDGVDTLLRALADSLVDGITIKLTRVGGLTKAKLIRDVAIARNLKITIEDTGGAEIDAAAYSGLMLSTPEGLPAAHRRFPQLGDRLERPRRVQDRQRANGIAHRTWARRRGRQDGAGPADLRLLVMAMRFSSG